jgi:hypothetical protein
MSFIWAGEKHRRESFIESFLLASSSEIAIICAIHNNVEARQVLEVKKLE